MFRFDLQSIFRVIGLEISEIRFSFTMRLGMQGHRPLEGMFSQFICKGCTTFEHFMTI